MIVKSQTRLIALFLIVFNIVFLPIDAFAVDKTLPEMMVGQTTISQQVGNDSKIYYGGFTGNEIIYNRSNDTRAEFEYSKTGRTGLATCIGADLKKVVSCFYLKLSPSSSAVRLLRSRTSINGVESIETAALLYGSKQISGDAYSGSNDINNFAFWGKSLAISRGDISSSDAPWKISGYELNNYSQSSWLDSKGNKSSSIDAFASKLKELYSNSTRVPSNVVTNLAKDGLSVNLYLQAEKNSIASDIYQRDQSVFPDGKVWSIDGDLIIGKNKQIVYRGVGTIAVKGNVVMGEGSNFVPADESKDYLGVIVLDE